MQFGEPIFSDTDFMTIEEIKKETTWPYDWLSVKGIAPYIKRMKGDNITGVEIGTCRAESTAYLLEECPNIKKLYTLDPFAEFTDWVGTIKQEIQDKWKAIAEKNLAPYGDRVEMLQIYSADAVNFDGFFAESLDFVFIDGDHSYEGVLADLQGFYPFLRKGGIFAGHDYQMTSVRNALLQFRSDAKITIPINRVDNQAWFWHK